MSEAVKGFHWTSKTWYALLFSDDRVVDEIMIGFYFPGEGGTTGEFAIRWRTIGESAHARLEVFDDGWSALRAMPELVLMLSQIHGTPTPEFIQAELIRIGFVDMTNYERR